MTKQAGQETIHYVPANGGKRSNDGGIVMEVATGFVGILWGVAHPGKTLLRAFGATGAIAACLGIVGFGAHLIAGNPGAAQLNGADPFAVGRVTADMVRPHVERSAAYVNRVGNPNLEVREQEPRR